MNQMTRIFPPEGKLSRLKHYGKRYGYLHAVASYLGRKSHCFWRLVAPVVTRPYLERWKRANTPRILNLGGGGVLDERWLTADIDPRSDVWTDLTQTLPFDDSTIDVVYLEEVIEHLSLTEGERLLSEVWRILKPSGNLRITTPSLDYFMSLERNGTESDWTINNIFYNHGHRRIYSELGIRELLQRSRFREIRQSFYRDQESPVGLFDSHYERFPEYPAESSQYWDAIR